MSIRLRSKINYDNKRIDKMKQIYLVTLVVFFAMFVQFANAIEPCVGWLIPDDVPQSCNQTERGKYTQEQCRLRYAKDWHGLVKQCAWQEGKCLMVSSNDACTLPAKQKLPPTINFCPNLSMKQISSFDLEVDVALGNKVLRTFGFRDGCMPIEIPYSELSKIQNEGLFVTLRRTNSSTGLSFRDNSKNCTANECKVNINSMISFNIDEPPSSLTVDLNYSTAYKDILTSKDMEVWDFNPTIK